MKKLLYSMILIFLFAISSAFAINYLTFGRNPVVRGGLTQADLKSNESYKATPQDYFITMFGGSGERVSGWMKVGTMVKVKNIGEKTVSGKKIITWYITHIQCCGNPIINRITFETEEDVPCSLPKKEQSINVYVTVNNTTTAQATSLPNNIAITQMVPGGSYTNYAPSTLGVSAGPTYAPANMNFSTFGNIENNPSFHVEGSKSTFAPVNEVKPVNNNNPVIAPTFAPVIASVIAPVVNGGAGGNAAASSSSSSTSSAGASAGAQKK